MTLPIRAGGTVRGPGIRLVEMYLVLYIAMPAIGYALFGERLTTIYRIEPHVLAAILETVSVFILVLLFRRMARDVMPGVNCRRLSGTLRKIGRYYLRLRFFWVFLAFLIGIWFTFSGQNAYRYTLGNTFVNSPLLLFSLVVNTILEVDAVYSIFVATRVPARFTSRLRLENILLAAALVLLANGTSGMLLALAFSMHAIAPNIFRRLIFSPRKRWGVRSIFREFLGVAGLVCLFAIAWVAGNAIKVSATSVATDQNPYSVGVTTTIEYLGEPEVLENFGYYLLSSFSHHYYSLLAAFGSHRSMWITNNAIQHPLSGAVSRANSLLGSPLAIPDPEFSAVGRLNYEIMTEEPLPDDTQGTSPGILASSNYVSPIPLAILFSTIYLSLFSAMIDRLVRGGNGQRITNLGIVLLLLYLNGFFQSPIDLLLVFDNLVISVLLILAISLSGEQDPRSLAALRDTHSLKPRVVPEWS